MFSEFFKQRNVSLAQASEPNATLKLFEKSMEAFAKYQEEKKKEEEKQKTMQKENTAIPN